MSNENKGCLSIITNLFSSSNSNHPTVYYLDPDTPETLPYKKRQYLLT